MKGWELSKFAGRVVDRAAGFGVFRAVGTVLRSVASYGAKAVLAVCTLGTLVLSGVSGQAQTNLVAYNEGTGAVTFTPGFIMTPIIGGVIAAVGAGVALVIIAVGVRWVYRIVKGSK